MGRNSGLRMGLGGSSGPYQEIRTACDFIYYDEPPLPSIRLLALSLPAQRGLHTTHCNKQQTLFKANHSPVNITSIDPDLTDKPLSPFCNSSCHNLEERGGPKATDRGGHSAFLRTITHGRETGKARSRRSENEGATSLAHLFTHLSALVLFPPGRMSNRESGGASNHMSEPLFDKTCECALWWMRWSAVRRGRKREDDRGKEMRQQRCEERILVAPLEHSST